MKSHHLLLTRSSMVTSSLTLVWPVACFGHVPMSVQHPFQTMVTILPGERQNLSQDILWALTSGIMNLMILFFGLRSTMLQMVRPLLMLMMMQLPSIGVPLAVCLMFQSLKNYTTNVFGHGCPITMVQAVTLSQVPMVTPSSSLLRVATGAMTSAAMVRVATIGLVRSTRTRTTPSNPLTTSTAAETT